MKFKNKDDWFEVVDNKKNLIFTLDDEGIVIYQGKFSGFFLESSAINNLLIVDRGTDNSDLVVFFMTGPIKEEKEETSITLVSFPNSKLSSVMNWLVKISKSLPNFKDKVSYKSCEKSK